MNELIESIVFSRKEIARIISEAESIANDDTISRYTREEAKVSAYEKIVELLKGENA